MNHSEKLPEPLHRISTTAVIITLLSVCGAVLFGIFGPKIADRLTLLGGIPLSEVMAAAAEFSGPAQIALRQQESATPLDANQQSSLLARLLGRPFHAPNLCEAGYELRNISGVSLPGAPFRCAELVYEQTAARGGHWLVLYLAADDGQYVSFDTLGRSQLFMPNNLLVIDSLKNNSIDSTIFIWSDGLVLHVACVADEQEFDSLQPLIGAP